MPRIYLIRFFIAAIPAKQVYQNKKKPTDSKPRPGSAPIRCVPCIGPPLNCDDADACP